VNFVASALTLAVGVAGAGGLYWALLNVPESNVLALVVSGLLVAAAAAAIGTTLGASLMLSGGARAADATRRALAALPAFFLGLTIVAFLWWITGAADAWWTSHRGEVDAAFIRYAGTARTGRLHQAFYWITFLIRWALGLSVLAGLVSAAAAGGSRIVTNGLRTSIRLVPLAASIAGVVIVSELLWRVVYWRPDDLPPTSIETAFVAVKLFVLYLLAAVIGAGVLAFFRQRPVSST
jgi:hypothetical protein